MTAPDLLVPLLIVLVFAAVGIAAEHLLLTGHPTSRGELERARARRARARARRQRRRERDPMSELENAASLSGEAVQSTASAES